MPRSAQPDDRADDRSDDRTDDRTDDRYSSAEGLDAGFDSPRGSRTLDGTELDSALQLLVERAQYITGSTGAALALPEGGEMVCRASAGSSAPAVGARLQVRSGLTAESIARRQLLRCNNAESDPRVNLEACRALGIASIVVLPLLRRNGEVRGLFELFSDHPYAFEERDLIALERMADLTLTALDLAEQSPSLASAVQREPSNPAESLRESLSKSPSESPSENLPESLLESLRELSVASGGESSELSSGPASDPVREQGASPTSDQPKSVVKRPTASSEIASYAIEAEADVVVPEAMVRVQKCESCGFPVSEGRTLCLDCEKKDSEKKPDERQLRQQDRDKLLESASTTSSLSSSVTPDEFVPAFLVNSASQQGSWLSNHVNLLAIVALILGILVAVVIFR